MSTRSESPLQWRPRQRIRPKRYQSTPNMRQQIYQLPGHAIGGPDAKTLGPRDVDSGLAYSSTRSLKLLFPRPHNNPSPQSPSQTIGASACDKAAEQKPAPPKIAPARLFTAAAAAAHLASASVPPAVLIALFPANHSCIAIRHEYLLQMSKKSKRMGRAGAPAGGFDIMDSLVSSIDEIESKQMRGSVPLSNGHRRQLSDEFESVIMVSPAPVIQTSKSSTRTSGTNKLSKRSSPRNSVRENGTRLSLRSSSSQEHWLPPIEQEEDFFSIPTGRRSYSSTPFNEPAPHPSIPTRSTSIAHEIPTASIPQRANSLLHPPVSSSVTRPAPPRRSETSDIPSYIHRYLRERNDSKENLSLDIPKSPRRSPHPPRSFPSRSRNSTTAIPANDNLQRLKLLTKRQSSQGFERDLSATRHFYSLPSPTGPRRSASLKPSRSSVASDTTSMSGVNSNYVQEVLSNPKLTQRIRLTSGRILSFSEVVPNSFVSDDRSVTRMAGLSFVLLGWD